MSESMRPAAARGPRAARGPAGARGGGRGWRNLCFVLGAICAVQAWRGRAPVPEAAEPGRAAPAEPPRAAAREAPPRAQVDDAAGAPPAEPGMRIRGFGIPAWATWLAPRPGEPLRDYRDRVLPFAQQAIAPQRARVARWRDGFAAAANLRPPQLAELDRTTQDTASALEERVLGAVMNGEISPGTFKPMAGVDLARDLADIVSKGNQRFLDSLDPGQQAVLATQPFDFADYLACSTRWEDALGLL